MASKIFPDELEEHTPGEQFDFQFDFVDELDGGTFNTGTVQVFDADGVEVTQKIAPSSGFFADGSAAAWTVSGTTLTITMEIPKKDFSSEYLALFRATSSTGEKFQKFLGILVTAPAGVF